MNPPARHPSALGARAPSHGASGASRLRPWGCLAVVTAALTGMSSPAQATITLDADAALTTTSGSVSTHTRRLTMRVGSNLIGEISTVTFNVTGGTVGPTPTPIAGLSNFTNVSGTPANSVRVSVSNRWTDFAGNRVIVTADSSTGLACTAGPCGSTVIPFSKISWTSSGLQTGANAGRDFASGSFSDSSTQPLLDFTVTTSPMRSFSIVNEWNFTYSNDTLYPAGTYQGRVTFTATMP